VYFKALNGKLVIIALYVDDIFIYREIKSEKESLYKKLAESFDIKILGPVTSCLGMKVERDRNKGIWKLNQGDYARRLLSIVGL